jgi:4-coumarate--CoA ligase
MQGYGLTESTAIGSMTPADGADFADHFGSAGMLAPGLEAMMVDASTNKPMPPTQQGEIWLRGPTIMKGNNNTFILLPGVTVFNHFSRE